MQDFVHLHVHTQYSLLDGQASVSRLVDKAHEGWYERHCRDRPWKYVRYQGVHQLCQQEEQRAKGGDKGPQEKDCRY